MSSDRRYTITRLDGYATSSPQREGEAGSGGTSFHVLDGRAGQLVAVYRSEDAPIGLPPVARIRLAERRARDRADALEAAHAAAGDA